MTIISSFQHLTQAIVEMLDGLVSFVTGVCRWPIQMMVEVINIVMDAIASLLDVVTGELHRVEEWSCGNAEDN